MATNNYYNFTHGGTQYGAQYTPTAAAPGTAYPPPAYPPQPAPGTAPAYPGTTGDPYVIAGYTRPSGQQQAAGYYTQPQGGSVGYTATKMVGAAVPSPRPAVTSTVYPTYSANTTGTTTSGSYAGFAPPPTQTQSANPNAPKSFTNYDAAVYNAVSAYAQGGSGMGRGIGGPGGFKKGQKMMKGPRPPPKPQTLHYCDVCKISCAGPQTYKEHLEGQKHKKKEAAQKSGTPTVPKGGPVGLRCELCDVTCTGSDAYAAHIRGAKHQKVVKLHTKLGKPIPSDNPTVIAGSNSNSSYSSSKTTGTIAPTGNNFVAPAKPVPAAAPKISFTGKEQLVMPAPSDPKPTMEQTIPPIPPMSTTYTTPAAPGGNASVINNGNGFDKGGNNGNMMDYVDKDVQPVGQDYIEEIRNEEGKVTSFNCKLCDCKFNDPNAKEMHMKGRRHRLQYKKKVNPDLIVDIKPSSRQKKLEERRAARAGGMRKPLHNDMFPRPFLPAGQAGRFPGPAAFGGPGPAPFFGHPVMRRPETMDDRHVMAKHAEIYPEELELQAIQKIVSNTEKALKLVSDKFAEEDCRAIKIENQVEPNPPTDAELQVARKLKGVMRVGTLAKGLLLKGDRVVELVVLCSEKPNQEMLQRVHEALPIQLEAVASDEKYNVDLALELAGVTVSSNGDPRIEVVVTLTSPLFRTNSSEAPGEAQATQVPEPNDVLDKEKCLGALAALRHAKWFQARATTLQSCVIVIRVLRDLWRRTPELQSMSSWAVELLVEKAINSAGIPVSPGEALRIVFEILGSGFLLHGCPGILDPCEKESCDALSHLDGQTKENVTAFAQQALRQIAFRRIHQLLGMEQLPRYNKDGSVGNRKRRRDPSGNVEGDETDAGNDLKKDKKDLNVSPGVPVEVKSEICT